MAIPLGVLTALYLAEAASARVREVVKPIVELLAALPSVVIGFFGMVVVAPFLQNVLNIPITHFHFTIVTIKNIKLYEPDRTKLLFKNEKIIIPKYNI